MSSFGPFGDDPDLAAAFQQMFRLLGSGGGGSDTDRARAVAASVANDGRPEPNVDPTVRLRIEELARVAELQVIETSGLDNILGVASKVSVVSRTGWTAATVGDYWPLFQTLSETLGTMLAGQIEDITEADLSELAEMMPDGMPIDMPALMAGLSGLMGPMMLVTLAGSTVGQLGRRAFGGYELPIPRAGDRLLVVGTEIDDFAREWSLDPDDVRLWVVLREMSLHAVLSLPHVAERLTDLLARHARGFRADPEALAEQLGDIDPSDPSSMERLSDVFADPNVILRAIRSPEQLELVPHIDALVSTVCAYSDWVVDRIGSRFIASYPMVTEALRRRRIEVDLATQFVERLFGLELTQEKLDVATAFIDGLVERGGTDAPAGLWTTAERLPTPPELSAPGLWLARVRPDAAQELPELDEPADVPDFWDLDS